MHLLLEHFDQRTASSWGRVAYARLAQAYWLGCGPRTTAQTYNRGWAFGADGGDGMTLRLRQDFEDVDRSSWAALVVGLFLGFFNVFVHKASYTHIHVVPIPPLVVAAVFLGDGGAGTLNYFG